MTMKKYYKIIISIMLIGILSINSFAAIVSDSDGSAFVTKTEFDALRNNLDKQINDYNRSINAKIDGAIASYLAGIKVSLPPDNLYNKLKDSLGGEDLWMKNYVPTDKRGSNTIKNQFTLNVVRRLYYAYYSNLVSGWKAQAVYYSPNTTNAAYRGICVVYVENNLKAQENTSTSNGNVLMSQGYKIIMKPGNGAGENALNLVFPEAWASGTTDQINPDGTRNIQKGLYNYNAFNRSKNTLNEAYKLISACKVIQEEGEGSAWVYHRQANGNLLLREYAKTFYPVQTLDIDAHTYKNFAGNINESPLNDNTNLYNHLNNYYGKENGLKDDTAFSITIAPSSKFGTVTDGTRVDDDDKNEKKQYYKYSLSQMKINDDVDYSLYQWGRGCDTTIHTVQDVQQPELGTETTIDASASASKFYGLVNMPCYATTKENDLSGVEVKYTPNTFTTQSKQLNAFTNQYLTSIAGENVKIGGGIPIASVKDADQTNTFRIKFKCRNAAGNLITDTIHYELSDKQFVNGALAPEARSFASGDINAGEFISDITITDLSGIVWLNMYANTDGNDAAIDAIGIR